MKIPKELIKKWEVLRSDLDTERIAEAAGVHKQTVRNAFNTGKCSDEVFKAMADFYSGKEVLINQYILQPA